MTTAATIERERVIDATVEVHAGRTPLVIDSPHSGTHYPADFRPACPLPLLRMAEDTHVDRLWSFAPGLGAAVVCAKFPRSYIDANRALEEMDPELLASPWPGPVSHSPKVRLGKGLVWRVLDDGTPIYDRPLTVGEVQRRISRCWMPYHAAVKQAVDEAHRRHGCVVHLNCHSMPSVAGAYATEHPFQAHPDMVLGDRDGSTASPWLTRWIELFLNSRGYTVSINHPYKGVELVRLHGRPQANRHSVQLEVNRRLYMDENTLEIHSGFETLQNTLRELAQALTEKASRDAGNGDAPW